MGSWFKQFEALVWAATIALGALVFVYQAFATKEFVNVKHEGVMDVLKDIRQDVRDIRHELLEKRND